MQGGEGACRGREGSDLTRSASGPGLNQTKQHIFLVFQSVRLFLLKCYGMFPAEELQSQVRPGAQTPTERGDPRRTAEHQTPAGGPRPRTTGAGRLAGPGGARGHGGQGPGTVRAAKAHSP